MAAPTTTPLDRERPFGADELFFSTTDRRGVILAGNAVFQRVADYAEEELIGQAHNIVRHPDMPRGVFRVFWDHLDAKKPIAAYVKNMARDGAYYWVVATAVPMDGGGYLSVRTKPRGPHFAAAKAVYAALLAYEAELEAAGTPRKELVELSVVRLLELLAGAGYPDYASFMHELLPIEVGGLATRADAPPATHPSAELDEIRAATRVVADELDAHFRRLDAYGELNRVLAEKARFVSDLSGEIGLFAINALIAAARLGEHGATLGVVADAMRVRAEETATLAAALDGEVVEAGRALRDLCFGISIARLQTAMTTFFVDEQRCLPPTDDVALAGRRCDVARAEIAMLARCIRDRTGLIDASLAEVNGLLQAIGAHAAALARHVHALEVLHVNGRIEVAHIENGGAFAFLFDEIRREVARATEEVATLVRTAAQGQGLHLLGAAVARAVDSVEAHSAEIEPFLVEAEQGAWDDEPVAADPWADEVAVAAEPVADAAPEPAPPARGGRLLRLIPRPLAERLRRAA